LTNVKPCAIIKKNESEVFIMEYKGYKVDDNKIDDEQKEEYLPPTDNKERNVVKEKNQ